MSSFANCSQELGIQVRILAGFRGSASAVALLLTVGLMMITHHYAVAKGKKWLKRSLYLAFISSITYLAVLFISIFYIIFPSSWLSTWCKIFGFLDQLTSIFLTSMLLINIHPSVTLIVKAIFQGHDEIRCCKNSCRSSWIVPGYVGSILGATVLEIISSFVPFFVGAYGPVGGWCWISDEESCKNSKKLTTGLWEQMFLWYIIEAIGTLSCITIMLTAVGISMKMVLCDYESVEQTENCQEVPKNRGNVQKKAKAFCKAIIQLTILIPILFNVIHFGLRASGNNSPFVWVTFAISPPAIGFFIPLSLVLYTKYRPDEAKSGVRRSYGTLKDSDAILSSSSGYYYTTHENNSSFVEL